MAATKFRQLNSQCTPDVAAPTSEDPVGQGAVLKSLRTINACTAWAEHQMAMKIKSDFNSDDDQSDDDDDGDDNDSPLRPVVTTQHECLSVTFSFTSLAEDAR